MSERWSLLVDAGRFADALEEARRELANDPECAEAHANAAYCLCLLGGNTQAIDAVHRSRALDPEDGWARWVHALSATQAGKFYEAEKAIEEAAGDDDEIWWIAALCSSYQGHWQECLARAERGLAFDPEDSACHEMRAEALRELSQSDEAEAADREAIAFDPESERAHAGLGWTLLRRGRSAEALPHLREALRLDPDSEWAREGVLHALRARNPVYRRFLRLALALNAEPALIWIPLVIAWFVLRGNSGSGYVSIVRAVAMVGAGFALAGNCTLNLLLRIDPEARRMMGWGEMVRGEFAASAFGAVVLGAVLAICGASDRVTATGMLGLLMLQPLMFLIHWPVALDRAAVRTASLLATASGGGLIFSLWTPGDVEGTWVIPAVFLLLTWLAYAVVLDRASR